MAKNKTEGGSSIYIKAAQAFLDLLDRIKTLRWKGILDGILKLLFLVCFAMALKFVINPRPTIEYYMTLQEKIQDERHQELINKRVENTPKINDELNLLQVTLDVDRAFIIEFHNGTNNMALLPFWLYNKDGLIDLLENPYRPKLSNHLKYLLIPLRK